jgi:hypothetical protein
MDREWLRLWLKWYWKDIVQAALISGYLFWALKNPTFRIGSLVIVGAVIAGVFMGAAMILAGQSMISDLKKKSGLTSVFVGVALIIWCLVLTVLH